MDFASCGVGTVGAWERGVEVPEELEEEGAERVRRRRRSLNAIAVVCLFACSNVRLNCSLILQSVFLPAQLRSRPGSYVRCSRRNGVPGIGRRMMEPVSRSVTYSNTATLQVIEIVVLDGRCTR